MLLYVIELWTITMLVAFVVSQVVMPLFNRQPMFPLFRKPIRLLDEAEVQTTEAEYLKSRMEELKERRENL